MSPAAEALFALPENACRWPKGKGWCREPVEAGRPYCARHHRRSVDPLGTALAPRTIDQILRLRPRAAIAPAPAP